MTPTQLLRDEHHLILKALDVLEATADRLSAGDEVPAALWEALLDWLHTFADVRHHAKEEELFFPALVRAGLPERGGPVAAMMKDHDLGRALVLEMTRGEPRQRAEQARRYARLLRDHLAKEDRILFPLAEELLAPAETERLRREFERADLDEPGRAWSLHAADTVLTGLAGALKASIAR
jgi:hemerythrin-like domain-containing protein